MKKVFIGSTSRDLAEYRQAAIDTCIQLGLFPVAMEFWEALSAGATDGSKRKLDEADVYLGFFAFRYGYIENGQTKSVTEIEFDYAGERGLERLCLIADKEHPFPPALTDPEHWTELNAFKKRVGETHIVQFFTTVDDFKAKVMHTLVKWKERQGIDTTRHGSSSAVFAIESDSIPGKTDKFRGRTDLIQQIHTALNNGQKVLLQGFGGMGKTALAAECAGEHLPVLWVRAGSDSGDAVFEALARPFNAHQAIASQTGEARTALMKQILAGSGAKLLLIDDVWNGATLKQLIKAVPSAIKVIITSRHRYPEGTLLRVAELSPSEAMDVLSTYTGRDLSGDKDAPALCKLLGYHVFALEIAGSTMKEDDLSAGELYQKIQNAPQDMHMPEDYADEERKSVKQLLDASFNALEEDAKKVFLAFGAMFVPSATAEMLALYLSDTKEAKSSLDLPDFKEGEEPDVSKLLEALQALLQPKIPAKPDTASVENALTILVRRGLVEKIPATDESIVYYHIHDLAYSYAKAQTTDDQRHRALDACLNYTRRYNEPSLPNFAALRPELDNFLGAAAFAMQTERWSEAERFAWNLYMGSEFLDYKGFYTGAMTLLEQAAFAAEKQGNKQSQGAHLTHLGLCYAALGQVRKAITFYEQAVEIHRELGDKKGEGADLGNLGNAYRNLGEYPQAIDYHQQALQISRDIGDKRGEGSDLGNLGNAYFSLGEYPKAIDCYQQAIKIRRDIGDRMGEANDLNNIGALHETQGNYDLAIQFYQQARDLRAAMGLTHMVEKTDARIAEAKRLKEQASGTQES